ncbi:MAG: efflux RND transporter periplasmic adaptor subunit, partial [Desulfobacterales bacterium]|nr:efflux RND transporter periplasmic adaptor subunit [Desulfobacterales bacterium]
MKRIFIYIFIAGAVLCALFFIFRAMDKDKTRDDVRVGQASVSVDAAPAVFHEFEDRIDAVGTLRARETNLLNPKVAGNVDAVLVDIGDWVEAGQVVVLLDRTQFKLGVDQSKAACQAAKAAVAQAVSLFEQAQKEYRRASKLLAEKVIPQIRFDAAESTYKATREGLAVAKGKYSQAQTAMETAREHLKDARIRSSIAGVVVDRNVEVGQSVSPGVQILRILDQTTMKGDFELPEKDIGRVTIGTAAVITVDAFQGQEFPGKVTVINPMVDPRARTFRVRIEAPNPSGKLVDGMFARVKFLTGQRTALAIPRDALHRLPGSGTFYVFIVQGDKV